MKNSIKIAAILIPLFIAILLVPVSYYSHTFVVSKAVAGDQVAASVNGDTVKEIVYTIKNF
jgi:hypothetical protein